MLNVLDWFRSRSATGRTATELYGSIVAQARHPDFYTVLGVEDVAEKRYELLVLHLSLVLARLAASGPEVNAVRQSLVEAFVRDLDGSMREMGIGDMSVPRKVKKAAGGFYDRDQLYQQAFGGDDEMTPARLIDELVFDGASRDGGAALARYAAACREGLDNWSLTRDGAAVPFVAPGLFVNRPGEPR